MQMTRNHCQIRDPLGFLWCTVSVVVNKKNENKVKIILKDLEKAPLCSASPNMNLCYQHKQEKHFNISDFILTYSEYLCVHQGIIEQYEPVIWEPAGVLQSQRSVAAFTDHTTPGKTQALLKNKITHINFLNKTRGTLVAHKLQHMSHNLMCFHTGCGRGCTLKTITFNRLYCTMMGCYFAEEHAV